MKYPGIFDCKWLGRNCAPILLAAILTGCADVELPEYPTPRISMEMTLENNVPKYTVTVDTKDGMDAREVGIVETYRNNNITRDKRVSTRVVHLEPSSSPNVYIGQSIPGYAMDEIMSYAYVNTDMGAIRSDYQTMIFPGNNIPVIKGTRFDFYLPTSNSGTLMIYGENFSPRPNAVSIKSDWWGIDVDNATIQNYSDSIVVKNIECHAVGGFKMFLTQNDKSYTFYFNVKDLHIDSISPSTVKIGEPLTLYYSDATPDGIYEFNTRYDEFSNQTMTLSQDDHHTVLLPIYKNVSFSILTTTMNVWDVGRHMSYRSYVEFTTIRDIWEEWDQCGNAYNCQVGNYLCSTIGKRLYCYNITKHKLEFITLINHTGSVIGSSALGIDDRYAYVWYWTSDMGYLVRYDTKEQIWENVTSQTTPATKAWFENENTFRALKDNKLITYHLDTNTWDDPEFLYTSDNSEGMTLNEDSQMCGSYEGHFYFGQSGKVYRYPVGNPKDISFVGKPNRPFNQAFRIQNGNLYFGFIELGRFYFIYIFKMPMKSLIEGTNEITCVGCPTNYNYTYPKTSFCVTDDYYLVTIDGSVQALKK